MKLRSLIGISCQALLVLAALVCVRASYGADVSFYGIGQLPGGGLNSQVRSAVLTSTGILAGGNAQQNPATGLADTAVLWTPTEGLVTLSSLLDIPVPAGNRLLTVSDISSGNQTVAARISVEATGRRVQPALYTAGGQLIAILGLPDSATFGAANAVSSNGQIAYGFFTDDSGNIQGFRWTVAGGTEQLPAIAGYSSIVPSGSASSSDGGLEVGAASSPTGTIFTSGSVAYVYTAASDTMSLLPFAPGGTWAGASGIDVTGTYIVGVGDSPTYTNGELLLWTTGVVTELGVPAAETANGINSNFIGVTKDGAVVVVAGALGSYIHNAYGWSDLQTALSAGGGSLAGWTTLNVMGCNAEGTLVFGFGTHNGGLEGFVAQVSGGYLKDYGKPKKTKG